MQNTECPATPVAAYAEWHARVKVYDATETPPAADTAYYHALLDSVAPERVSVPVLVHALLEQVTRNAQGQEAASELEDAWAQSSAAAALEDAFAELGWGSGSSGGSQPQGPHQPGAATSFHPAGPQAVWAGSLTPVAQRPPPHTLVVEGDGLAAAAAGLVTGWVHPVAKAGAASGEEGVKGGPGGVAAAGARGARTSSPTSVFDGPAAAGQLGGPRVVRPDPAVHVDQQDLPDQQDLVSAGVEADSDVAAGGGQGEAGVGVGLPLFVPGGGLDVDAVEQHMMELVRVPGAGRVDMPLTPLMDDLARSLRATAIKAQAKALPLGMVQRCQLLDQFVDMLPPSTQEAHAERLLARHHHELMQPHVLKQVLTSAQLQLPHSKTAYHAMDDAALVALFAGDYERREALGIPVALTFSHFFTRCAKKAEEMKSVSTQPSLPATSDTQ
ncbi:uncharacterized protein HaLaN_08400, partial [Haematococcus lacustris]